MGAATVTSPTQAARPGRLLRLARALDALLDDPRVGADEIAVYVALARHCDVLGRCRPGQGTIAGYLQRSRPWVNARIARMVEAGIITRRRQYRQKGGETACAYHLPALDAAASPPGDATDRCRDGDTPCQPADTPCHDGDTNRDSHRPTPHQPTERPVVSLDAEGLARRFQRASAGRWRLDTVRPLVVDALSRVGVDAVKRLASEVDGAGLPAWEIRRRLQGLSQVSDSPTSTPARAVVAPTVAIPPTQDAAEIARRREVRHALSRLDELYRDPGQADHLDAIVRQIETSPRPGGGVWTPADVHRAGYRVPLASAVVDAGIAL